MNTLDKKKSLGLCSLSVLVGVFLLSAMGLSPTSAEAEDLAGNVVRLEAAASESTFVVPPQPGTILLLDDLGSPGQEGKGALDAFGYTYTHVSPASFATVNLDDYDIIYVAWLPSQVEVDALNARKADLEAWISDGGGIVVNAEWENSVTNPYSFLPLTFDTGGTPYYSDGVQIVDTSHPLAAGLTDALLSGWGSSVHGRITVWPPEADVVSIATVPEPDTVHMAGMCYGGGKIVVAASDPEFHVLHSSGDAPWIMLSNELNWASVPCLITVEIDIKPGSCPNPLNVRSKGVLPVAILGSEDFDVGMIDVASIRLADVAPIRSSFEDVAAPVSNGEECECTTEGPDGYTDLSLKFKTQAIVEALGEVADGEELVLTLTGELLDERPIEGEDCIRVIKKGKESKIGG